MEWLSHHGTDSREPRNGGFDKLSHGRPKFSAVHLVNARNLVTSAVSKSSGNICRRQPCLAIAFNNAELVAIKY